MTLGWEIPKWENRTMGWAKVNQMAPNRTQKMPKGSQKGANGSHKWAKGSKQWIKSDLNSTYNQYKRQCREKDEKKEACSSISRSVLGPIFHQRCSKSEPKRPKWSQNRAEGSQKIAKREPNGDQNASKSRCSENEAKSMQTYGTQQRFLGAIRVPFGS